jgi:hypothetical protein
MLEDFEYLTRLAEDLQTFAKASADNEAKRACFLIALSKVAAAAEAVLLLAVAEEAEGEALPN